MILLYPGNDQAQADTARQVLDQSGIPYSLVTDNEAGQKINTLTKEKTTGTGPAKGHLFIFYDDLDRKLLGKVDADLQKAGVDTTHKAARTEVNGEWPLQELMEEVEKEAAWFQEYQTLYQLVANPDRKRLETDPAYMDLMAGAWALLESNTESVEQLKQAIAAIRNA